MSGRHSPTPASSPSTWRRACRSRVLRHPVSKWRITHEHTPPPSVGVGLRRKLTLTVSTLVAVGALAAPAGAERLPVDSRHDETASLAGRIDAIANVVAVMGQRIVRIGDLAGSAPGPPNEPLLAAQANALAIADLAEELLCPSGRIVAGGGEVLIADDDRDAADTSATGLANQAEAVATVLAQAQRRLATIADAVLVSPGPPDEPETAALTALYAEAAAIVNRISDLLGLDLLLPPGPS